MTQGFTDILRQENAADWQAATEHRFIQELVQGTVRLAHSLNLTVTAVGVETYPQLDLLRDLEVDAAQGYVLTPPLNAEDLGVWLQNRL